MAADVFESYEVTLVAAIILGAAASTSACLAEYIAAQQHLAGKALTCGLAAATPAFCAGVYPLLIRAIGVFASIIGIYAVKGTDDMSMNPMKPINTGFWVSAILSTIGFYGLSYYVFQADSAHPWFCVVEICRR